MNDGQEELIKAGAAEIARPFQELLLKLLGPAADEIGGFWGEFFGHYRRKYASKLLTRVEQIVDEAHIEPQPVSPKLLHSILDNASLESEDELRERWAFLLANATDSRQGNPVSIAFCEILKELSSREVRFLEAWYKKARQARPDLPFEGLATLLFERQSILLMYAQEGLATDEKFFLYDIAALSAQKQREVVENWQAFYVVMDILERNGIAMRHMTPEEDQRPSAELADAAAGGNSVVIIERSYSLTNLGAAFIQACIKPIDTGA